MSNTQLPLRYVTPGSWAGEVLQSRLELLNDHAHLEKKAAGNALELLNRWPEPSPPENWVAAMTAVARDEVEHLAVVTRLLARRGGRLTRQHGNPYAADLHRLVRRGQGPAELVDRLLISALIEARSCERFKLLADACARDETISGIFEGEWKSGPAGQPLSERDRGGSYDRKTPDTLTFDLELSKLYRGLWASEHGHYRTFLQLAEAIQSVGAVANRWDQMLDSEAELIQRQAPGPRMHSGVEM